MRTTSFSEKIWLLVAGVLLVLTVLSVVQALAQDRQIEYYEQGRELLNRSEYEKAAQAFFEAYDADPRGDLAGESLYWQAFALYRTGETESLETASELLERHVHRYADDEIFDDAESLLTRIDGELARRGDADAARRVSERASTRERQREMERSRRDLERRRDRDLREHERDIREHERDVREHERQLRMEVERSTRRPELRSGDSAKIAALNALMMMDEDRALPVLRRILEDDSDDNYEVRRNAVFILGQIETDESEEILIDLAAREEDPGILKELIWWLGMYGGEEALDTILGVYRRSEDPDVRETAMYALGQHGGDRALVVLKDIAADDDAPTDQRADAIYSLARSEVDDIGEFLMELYRKGCDREVLEGVIHALGYMDIDTPAAWFEELVADESLPADLRGEALFAATQQDAFDADVLLSAYRTADEPEIKSHIFYALSDLDDDEALDALLEIADLETDPELREEIIFWIGQYDEDRAAEYLLKVINE